MDIIQIWLVLGNLEFKDLNEIVHQSKIRKLSLALKFSNNYNQAQLSHIPLRSFKKTISYI